MRPAARERGLSPVFMGFFALVLLMFGAGATLSVAGHTDAVPHSVPAPAPGLIDDGADCDATVGCVQIAAPASRHASRLSGDNGSASRPSRRDRPTGIATEFDTPPPRT